MIFFLNLDGTCTRRDTDHIYQGSNKASKVIAITGISPAQSVLQVAFTLPNGITFSYLPMNPKGTYVMDNDVQMQLWELDLPYNVTEVQGTVGISFNVVDNNTDSNMTSYTNTFEVEYSALPIPPTTATDEELAAILKLLEAYAAQNSGIINTHTQQIEEIQAEQSEQNEAITKLQNQVLTGETYVGVLPGAPTKPTDSQIQQYYSETVGRTPRLNDVFFFTQTLTSGYKVFKYIYTVTGWQNYEIPGANTGSNRNLLDNSDFAINQRGIYTLLNGTGFMADRWYKAVGGDFVQVDIVGSKCTLTAKKNLTSASRCFGQAIECSDLLKGKQVTFSVNVVSPNSYAVIQMHALNANKGVISSSSQKALATTGLHSITWTVPQDCIYLQVNIVIDLPRIPINSFVTFDSPKLEPGEVVTLYTPPNIAEELSKCQRFYFDTCYDLASASAIAPYSVGAGLCFSSILAYFNIPLPTTMLQSAKQMTSIKKVDNLTVLSNGKSIPITALDVIGSNNASVTLRATGNFDVGASAILRIASGINGLGILAFDAEI